MLPDDVKKAWNAFKKDYFNFRLKWDKKHPDLAIILDKFFKEADDIKKDPPKDDPADWWKKD